MNKVFNINLLRKIQTSNFVRRSGAFLTAVALAGVLGACATNQNVSDNNDIEQQHSVTDDTLVPNDSQVYNFDYKPHFAFEGIAEEPAEEVSELIDWTNAEISLKDKEENFCHLLRWDGYEPYHNFEIATYENSKNFGIPYYKVFDKDGFLKNGLTYHGVIYVNEYTTVLENEIYSEDKDKFTYTILNHNTGKTREIEASSLYSLNGYLVKCDLDGYIPYYQLLYPDGSLTSDNVYTAIAISEDYICLSKDGKTNIIDISTWQAKEIDGSVRSIDNNFIILRNKDGEGVYYLVDIEADLIEKIPCSFSFIRFVTRDEYEPTFACSDFSKIENKETTALYSASGERLSNYYEYISWDNGSGYVQATSSADYSTSTKVTNLINKYGVEELSRIEAYSLDVVNKTNLVIFRENGESGKFGVMDLNGTILLKPQYDSLFAIASKGTDGKPDPTALVGRINDKNITVVFDLNLNELLRGDYGFFEAAKKTQVIQNEKRLTLS